MSRKLLLIPAILALVLAAGAMRSAALPSDLPRPADDPAALCQRDVNANGVVDVPDIVATGADARCRAYLPVIVSAWRQPWPTITATPTRTPAATPTATITPTPTVQPTDPPSDQPTSLTAFHRAGQTFLTWREVGSLTGERYHVYRHTAPITAGNIAAARQLTGRWGPLGEGSSIFWTEREREPPVTANYVIADLAAPLADSTGLFVWTTHETGQFYYAITTVDNGVEDRVHLGAGNSLAAPVSEAPADPQPVLAWQAAGERGAVFTQYLDYERYNPTFDAPRESAGQQYAYNYGVAVPSASACDGTPPATYPVYLYLQGWGGRYGADPETPYDWCAIQVYGDDPHQTWYYGHSASYDYRQGGTAGTGPIVNYTEERLLRAIYDTLRGYGLAGRPADLNRVYVYGQSMGGSGSLALGLRYPNVFAAAHAGEPMTNYRAADGADGTVNWVEDVVWKWGTIAANLPISNTGRYAGPLAAYNGLGVWDWQNHQAQLVARRGDDTALISLDHGTQDDVLAWASQGQPVYGQFYASRRAFSGATVATGHTWLGFAGMGPMVSAASYAPFDGWQTVRGETVPGLTYAYGSSPVPPTGPASYNLNLEWSASWHDFAGPPTDTPGLWSLVLRTTDGSSQVVDVTPRRRQQFVIVPGASYRWENRRLADNVLLQENTLVADPAGLLTAPLVSVDGVGVRLSIYPLGSPPPTGTSTPTTTASRTPTATITGGTPSRTPTITPTASPASNLQSQVFPAAADAMLDNNVNPNANLGGADYLELYQSDADVRHFLVRFDLSTLPSGAAITAARLELRAYDADYDDGPQDAVVQRVTRAWIEGTGTDFSADGRSLGVTWGQAAPGVPWTTPGGDYDAAILDRVTLPANSAAWFGWNVTVAAQGWASGVFGNAGLLVRPENGDWRNHKFYSREAADSAVRPRLVVTYTLSGGATATPTATLPPGATPTPTPTPTVTRTPTVTPTQGSGSVRPWPDTTSGIHVFNDQISSLNMLSDAQVAFAATHYAGTQKMTRADADRLRSLNPNFLILHYRLGPGLGYRAAQGNCQPTGGYLQIIEGNDWVQEWPGEAGVQASWFFPWAGQPRVYNCDWGWYLLELNDAGYRTWWTGEALRQLAANADDGLFADSLSVPNYMGADHYTPVLPDVDAAFETAWATRIQNWIAYVKGRFGSQYVLIPNVGGWVNGRDATDYSAADGVMVEGFGEWEPGAPYDLADWQLQMDRILALTRLGKIIIAQPYTDGTVDDRMFLLSSYLLVKGTRSYLNLDLDLDPEWWPEYEIPIGSYLDGVPDGVAALYDAAAGVYRRSYTNGLALVNPGATSRTVALGGTYYQATPVGGGFVPANGDTSGWRVDYTAVTNVTVGAGRGAVLLNSRP